MKRMCRSIPTNKPRVSTRAMQFKLLLVTLLALVMATPAVSILSFVCLSLVADWRLCCKPGIAADILTQDEMINWLKTTNAKLTFVGEPIPGVNAPAGLVSREALHTTVTYCSQRVDKICGGACSVYTGGATCLDAPDTNCLAATKNVGFCSSPGCVRHVREEHGNIDHIACRCVGECNQLKKCKTHLDKGYCYTPDTVSILVGNY